MTQGWQSPSILVVVLSQSCPLGQALVNQKAFENIKIHLWFAQGEALELLAWCRPPEGII